MKKLLACALIFTSSMISAQIVDFNDETNVVLGSSANTTEILEANWDVVNISGTTRSISCKRRVISQVSGAQHQFCWGEICGPWGTNDETSTEIVTLADGDTSTSFYCKYRHNGNPGQSVVQFCWYDAADFGSDVCYNVNFCVDMQCIVNVEEQTRATFTAISPNPVQALSGFQYHFASSPESAEIRIYDQLGKLAKRADINSKEGLIMLDAKDFEDGVYVCHLLESNRIVSTQRMVVSK